MNRYSNGFRSLALAVAALIVAGCHSTSGGSTVPSPPPNDPAFDCPTSGVAASARSERAAASAAARYVPGETVRSRAPRRLAPVDHVPGLIAVVYDRTRFALQRDAMKAQERKAGASLVAEHDYPRIGRVSRVLAVDELRSDAAMAALQGRPGVKFVSRVGRRYASTVTTPYLTNDPYFMGFPGTSAPYYETATIPGQWDKHVTRLEYAWAYSQANNGSTIVNAGALGLPSVKIAIIDTGEDLNNPDLSGTKVVRAQCFITNPTSAKQSTGQYVTDPDGHGTDVAGIAAATIDNGVDFVGSGGNAALYAYRVFPTPDNTCLPPASKPDATCGASSNDIASAIDDAVKNGANVINMSLGCSPQECNAPANTCPEDATEGAAVSNAIAAGVIVVAAAGNHTPGDGESGIDAPACDQNVIAAGASGLADGQRNGTNSNKTGEYVASYSNYGTDATWLISAPGGDPYCPGTGACGDTDFLHWIENIYTSTPADSSYAGTCDPGNANDCRILIAGTSMATPAIAGIAALAISAGGSAYQSPSAMGSLLCSTADNINDPHQGCGRLDAYTALAKVVGDPKPPQLRR